MLRRRSKYGAKKTVVDNITFASQKEAERYGVLKLLKKAGKIRGELFLQPKYELKVNGFKVCGYVADFAYVNDKGMPVVEDVKGMRTRAYRIKVKLMKAVYGIDVQEV